VAGVRETPRHVVADAPALTIQKGKLQIGLCSPANVDCTIHAGAAAFYKMLSAQIAKEGITVNMILPLKIDTERVKRDDRSLDETRNAIGASLPIGGHGGPFAERTVWLCHEAHHARQWRHGTRHLGEPASRFA
jgi:NAD(P)-dependent dehydrogenase (short-subunit alcohol dehydrogenase family)